MMVFVSSSCVKHHKIIDSIYELANYGFSNIELSGGTKPYRGMDTDLLKAQKDLNINIQLHNYFPPPEQDFVLNLASGNDSVYNMSMEHCKKAIDLSCQLGSKRFGFHAGFLIDINLEQIGKKISFTEIADKEFAYDRFCKAYEILSLRAGNDVKLYIENNVFSASNFDSFNGVNPFMLTDLRGYKELNERIDFNLLLDVAHLKVSANVLENNFDLELNTLFKLSDYIHVSDNDGEHDTNQFLDMGSKLYEQLSDLNWMGKTVTLEVYETLNKVKTSVENIKLL